MDVGKPVKPVCLNHNYNLEFTVKVVIRKVISLYQRFFFKLVWDVVLALVDF